MKKVAYILIVLFSFISFSFTAGAEATTYKNTISDTTSIEEDFKVIGMTIEDYYYPTSYDYYKWYCVAMAESYTTNNDIQTYFYFYNPKNSNCTGVSSIDYKLNSTLHQSNSVTNLSSSSSKGLFKVKGFIYPYEKTSTIEVILINGRVDGSNQGIKISGNSSSDIQASIENAKKYYSFTSDFKATNNHNLTSEGSFEIELNYNSFLVIDSYDVVKVNITKDDNFANNWDWFWTGKDISLDLFFYNFDFPNHIKVEDVIYAKFQYDYLEYEERKMNFYVYGYDDYKKLLSTEHVISEYNQKSNKLRVTDYSQELDFKTFYLGNRYESEEFEFKNKIIAGEIDMFKHDCSVLLDSSYKEVWTENATGSSRNDACSMSDYTLLDEIEMLELHYENKGVLYQAQVVNKPVDQSQIGEVTVNNEKSWWEKLWDWIVSNLPQSLLIILVVIIAIPVVISIGVQVLPHLLLFILKLIFIYPIKLFIKLVGLFKRE